MGENELVYTSDEKGVVVTYYSEQEVLSMKRISYYIGMLTGFAIGSVSVLILVMVL